MSGVEGFRMYQRHPRSQDARPRPLASIPPPALSGPAPGSKLVVRVADSGWILGVAIRG